MSVLETIDGDYLVRTHPSGAVERVLIGTPPAPAPRYTLTRLEFRSRFQHEEKVAIYTAAESSIQIRIWLDDMNAAAEIRLDDPRTVAGVQALETLGLIGAGRAAEILTPEEG